MKEKIPTLAPSLHHEKRQPQIAIMEVLTVIFAPKIKLQGTEHLFKIEKLTQNGKRIVFMPNHLSHADYPAFDKALKRNGFEDIANKAIPLQGLRIERNRPAKFFARAYSAVHVWPQTIVPKDEIEKQKQKRLLEESINYVKDNFTKGYHLVIFPEGTRSKTGKLGKGMPETFNYLEKAENLFIVPVGICGTEKIHSPGRKVPFPHLVVVNFGQPINYNELKNRFQHLKRSAMKEAIIDCIMQSIANCLPSNYQGEYAKN